MSNLVTLIVLATLPAEAAAPSSTGEAHLRRLLQDAQSHSLPVVLSGCSRAAKVAEAVLPTSRVLDLGADLSHHSDWLVRAIKAGVITSGDAAGWLLVPAATPGLRGLALSGLARQLAQSPMVSASLRPRQARLLGFSRELYSELLQIRHANDLSRLCMRYPCEQLDLEANQVAEPQT